MKIGYLMQAGVPDFLHKPLSGPANHVKYVFRELTSLGHSVSFLLIQNGRIVKSNDLEHFEPITVTFLDKGPLRLLERVIRRVQSAFQLPYASFFESVRFAAACRQEMTYCDLYFERMGWMGYGGVIASRILHKPLVLEVNGDHLTELEIQGLAPKGAQRWLSITLTKLANRFVNHVVATGQGWCDQFVKRWSFANEYITVVENGSEVVNLLSRADLKSFSTQFVAKEVVRIVYVGAFEPWHGIDVLLRALAKVSERSETLILNLVGDGSLRKIIEQMVFELGLKNITKLYGVLDIDDVAQILAQSDIAVSSYCGRQEFSGLKLLDYKSAGLATIASGKDGQPEVIAHGETGWIVPPCDEDVLCEAILNLAENADFRRRMGRKARLEAEEFHSWANTVEKLLEIFEKCLNL